MAGFGLFELGLELFALPPLLFVLPSLLFINAVNYFFISTFNGFVRAKIVYSCVIVDCFWLRVLALIKVKILLLFSLKSKRLKIYLHNTGKYELVSLAGGIAKNHSETERTPWKTYGSLPISGKEAADCNSSQERGRLYAYGAFELDSVINLEKPDIYIGVQDFWGVDYAINKPWFNKINHALWITLDSLPLLPTAVEAAPKIKNYWVWSSFAEKEMHKLGHAHVKTLHGAIDVSDFRPFSEDEKASLRNISSNTNNFCITPLPLYTCLWFF